MSFDEWKAKQEQIHNDYDAENAWNAGAASRQAEIDELKVMIRKLVDNTIIGFNDELENQANELLKGESK